MEGLSGDYVIILPQAWELLVSWYGGTPEISRRGISQGTKAVVELHGLNLKVYRSSTPNADPVEMVVSKAATVREFKEMACKTFNVDGADVRVWDYFHKKPYALLDTLSAELGDKQVTHPIPVSQLPARRTTSNAKRDSTVVA